MSQVIASCGERIEQRHRIAAAEKLAKSDHPKIKQTCEKILAGDADDHPAVQAEAFYR